MKDLSGPRAIANLAPRGDTPALHWRGVDYLSAVAWVFIAFWWATALRLVPRRCTSKPGLSHLTPENPRRLCRVSLLWLGLFMSAAERGEAAPVVPEPLKPWVPWVLRDLPEHDCPRVAPRAAQRRCIWPGQLELNMTSEGARFSQSWSASAAGWLTLPGDRRHWPKEVLVNYRAASVLEWQGRPAVRVEPGTYSVKGELSWSALPQFLPVAKDTALVKVTLDRRAQAAQLDRRGRLWLRNDQTNTGVDGTDSVKVEVFRLLQDDIPLKLETELRLTVSGRPREISLGQLLPAGTELLEFDSPLPARVEPDGRLRIQARAGEWRVKARARYLGVGNTFGMRKLDALWPDQEVWSFRANPDLRQVNVSGAPAVDPSQLALPEAFRGLPTYLLSAEHALNLSEQFRGDAAPAAHRLNLARTLWLDFDGGGVTVKDEITGSLTRDSRLRARPTLQLGRVVVNGEPQLVTSMPGEDGTGVEVRNRQISVQAFSRVTPLKSVSASGWQHDFDRVRMTLNLPPGWQLWHVLGPDSVSASWLSRWDLWDLFICLLIVAALFRVLGLIWAAVGTAALALTYHLPGAPVLGWMALLAALPLLSVLPQGGFRKAINMAAHLCLAGLVVAVIGFAIDQVRKGFYPQLEQHSAINAARYATRAGSTPVEEAPVPASLANLKLSPEQMLDQASESERDTETKTYRYRPADNIQTGPGEPSWQWHRVALAWSGPVKADADLVLYLSPPWLTRALNFLRVALVCLLLYALGGRLIRQHWLFAEGEWGATPASKGLGTTASLGVMSGAMLVVLIASALYPDATHADALPSQTLLEELRAHLTKAPECVPHCASVQQTFISLAEDTLIIRQRVSAGIDVAFPMPADSSWRPSLVTVDGKNAGLAHADNKHWIKLSAGRHEVIILAEVVGSKLDIPFPLQPHNTQVNVQDWRVFGLIDNRVSGGTLQFERVLQEEIRDTLVPDPIRPFVEVRRELTADLDWQLTTTVSRIAPASGAINLHVPLLPGESVVTPGIDTESGHVVVALAARQPRMQWRSVIDASNQLKFSASETSEWIEHWRIQPSPRWHIEGEGLPPIKSAADDAVLAQVWRPWPGENLTLRATRPEPVSGATTTVESVQIDHRPGASAASLELSLRIRTSIGGEYRIPQPADAELQRILVDGAEQVIPRDSGPVVIPLRPGLQNLALTWKLNQGVSLTTETPVLALPTPARNIEITQQLPRDRWPILLNGPAIGPAMLYWGVLAVILVIAAELGVIVRSRDLSIPLNSWHWLLLALGMSSVNLAGSIPVVLWFFAMEARRRRPPPPTPWIFNLVQIGLVVLTVAAVFSLFYTIPQSLLSAPDMQVAGNGSSNYFYRWYQDHAVGSLPQGWVISLPLGVFRVAMLLWSLWLVFALMRWVRWGWQCFATGQLWYRKPRVLVNASDDGASADN